MLAHNNCTFWNKQLGNSSPVHCIHSKWCKLLAFCRQRRISCHVWWMARRSTRCGSARRGDGPLVHTKAVDSTMVWRSVGSRAGEDLRENWRKYGNGDRKGPSLPQDLYDTEPIAGAPDNHEVNAVAGLRSDLPPGLTGTLHQISSQPDMRRKGEIGWPHRHPHRWPRRVVPKAISGGGTTGSWGMEEVARVRVPWAARERAMRGQGKKCFTVKVYSFPHHIGYNITLFSTNLVPSFIWFVFLACPLFFSCKV
jgi:hypothetical protein